MHVLPLSGELQKLQIECVETNYLGIFSMLLLIQYIDVVTDMHGSLVSA